MPPPKRRRLPSSNRRHLVITARRPPTNYERGWPNEYERGGHPRPNGTPKETRRGLPGDPDDTHSRYIEAEVDGVVVGCLYLPNGNPAPGPKFDYKLRWFSRLADHARYLLGSEAPVILTGDYNVIPTELDAARPKRWVGDALFFPESRAAYSDLLDQGWTDALRHLHPDGKIYTFWDYFRESFGRDDGIRIDHVLLSPTLATGVAPLASIVMSEAGRKPVTMHRPGLS